jgi:hypothetical protein
MRPFPSGFSLKLLKAILMPSGHAAGRAQLPSYNDHNFSGREM